MARGKARAVFVDRDGVLNVEVDYLSSVADLELIPGSARAVAALKAKGFKVIVISNQSGVARGYFDKLTLKKITAELEKRLAAEGAELDAVYYCVHGPDEGCLCRKPGVKMIEQAAKRFNLDLETSYFVGDTTADVMAARNAGMTPVLVKTGKGGKDGKHDAEPEKTVADLKAAARWILKRP